MLRKCLIKLNLNHKRKLNNYMKFGRITILLFLFVLLSSSIYALKNCKWCGQLLKKNEVVCPKCLRKVRWPLSPERSIQGKVVVRLGEDAFIRHPYSQNRYWLANRNAGADPYGPIGTWGVPTAMRYLIHFRIPEAFKNANVDITNFKVSRARLILRTGHNNRKDKIPIIVFPLLRPFTEGIGKLASRFNPPTGCTWFNSSPNIAWSVEGGEYRTDIFSTGYISSDVQDNIIDVTSIISFLIKNFQKTKIWDDPGMIIMRDCSVYSECKYLNIYSFEAGKEKNVSHVMSPELYIE